MNFRVKKFIFLAMTLVLLKSYSCPQSGPLLTVRKPSQSTIVSNKIIEPDEEALKFWENDFFYSDEFWVIENTDNFFATLYEKNVDIRELQILAKNYSDEIPTEIMGTLFSFHYGDAFRPNGGYILISEDIKNNLSSKLLREAYSILYQSQYGPPSISSSSKRLLKKKIDRWQLPLNIKKKFLERIVKFKNRYHLPISKYDWSYLPDYIKSHFISKYTDPNNGLVRQAVKISLVIENENDIKHTAEKYSGNRDPKIIERYLRRKLKNSKANRVILPLENILSPFVRKKIYTFDPKGGPNCFNSGLCVNEGNNYNIKLTNLDELMEKLQRDYEYLSPDIPFKADDLILYTNKFGFLEHVVSYIDEKYVFTKNGINKFNPYMIQRRDDVEQLYFPDGLFHVFRYRLKRKSANIAGCDEIFKSLL